MSMRELFPLIFILYFSLFPNFIYGKVREHFTVGFDVGYSLSLQPKMVYYEPFDREILKLKDHSGHSFQFYPLRSLGIQLEFRLQKVEKKTEGQILVNSELKTVIDKRYYEHPYFFFNLFYKFNSFEDKRLFPYILFGIGGQDQFDTLSTAYKTGIGLKYNLDHEETKKGTTYFVINLNFGLFYIFPDSSMEFYRKKGHLSFYSGLEIGI